MPKVLLLGSSGIEFRAGADWTPLPELVGRELAALSESEWTCEGLPLYPSAGAGEHVRRLVEQHHPDLLLLRLTAMQFAEDFVSNRIRTRWPLAYRLALRSAERLKLLAGGGTEGSASPRGWLFRLPSTAGRFLLGAEPLITPEAAAEYSESLFETLAKFEDLPIACRLAPLIVVQRHQSAVAKRRVDAYNDLIRAACERSRLAYFDFQADLREQGLACGFAGDGIHFDQPTRLAEARSFARAGWLAFRP